MDWEKIWRTALGELELNISKANFTTWLKGTFIYDYQPQNGLIIIAAPSSFHQEWLEQKYHKDILQTLKKLLPEIKELKYKVASKEQPLTKQEETLKPIPDRGKGNLFINYTFDRFIVGNANRLAYATALAVAKEPGIKYNPLFIYGGVGLGKTHLMQAIGNEISKKNKGHRIVYASCENFTNEFINAIQNKKTEIFKKKYRQPDVLLIDDIQFLAGKESTQEEFFHTFNALYQENRQVVLTSDRPPQALSEVANRLISRFAGGMVADIKPPDLETRNAILKSRCKEKNIVLDEKIINYIASQIQSNIRELEGALNKIIIQSELYNCEPTLELIERMIEDLIKTKTKLLTSQKILKVVGDYFSLELSNLLGKSRQKEIVYPRQIVMYLLRKELDFSFPKIGKELSGKDHTTIIHGVGKIEKEIKYNENIQKDLELIKNKLYL